ncbi:MAG: 23S rRNA (uridine2552-2'-O)-methyltransferase [Lysobacterales bacterium]|jgi:23S rRNA (uridine2552-2'-O)-methyltransferase
MARSKSSSRWLNEHFDDPYVKLAQQRGFRARAAFKLLELHEKYNLLRKGMCVVDLGAAPGSWSQVSVELVGPQGRVIALDILEMPALKDVEFIQGDFTDGEPLKALEELLNNTRVDLVLSDMAPNISGVSASDQPRSIYLAELALSFAEQWLRPGGDFICKLFQGEGSDEFLQQCRSGFEKLVVRKPKASRPRSREVYVLGRGRKLL